MRRGAWTIERIYETFPRLAERKDHGGSQLSGGEQQMLAISRALLTNPHLLIMDEPTEGLAPVIVAQVEEMLVRLGEDGDMSVLVIEQNIGVATAISRNVAIMVNGRVNRIIDSRAPRRRPRPAAAPARRRASTATSDTDVEAGAAQDRSDDAPQPRAASTGPVRIYISNPDAADALVAAGADRAHRGCRAHASRRASRGSTRSLGKGASRLRPRRSGPPVVLVVGTLDTKGDGVALHPRHHRRTAACARGWSTSPPAARPPPATSPRRKSR